MFNISKGRFVEFFNRVKTNSPSTSGIVAVPLSATDTEANRQDDDDLTTFLAAAPNEQTAGGWVRKVLTDTELSAIAVNDAGNYFPATVPQVTWTGPTAGSNTVGIVFCYAPDTAGADSTFIPICHNDFAVTADGNDVILNSGDISRAS